MARRRLLTILAGSAVLSATLAGPAAATELVGASQDSVVEVAGEPIDAADQAVEDTADQAVEDTVGTVVAEPIAAVTDAVEETVAPSPSASREPSAPADDPAPSAPSSSDEPSEAVLAAGDVTAAPSLAFLTGTGGSAPVAQSRLDLPRATPAMATAPPASEAVPAPQVAPPPAEVADTQPSSMLAQTASRIVHDEGLPIVVLVAIASLLAAGSATVREARTVAA